MNCCIGTAWCSPKADYGPYNAHFLADGAGLSKGLEPNEPVLAADSIWSLSLWFHQTSSEPGTTLLAGMGDPSDEDSRFLGLEQGHPVLRFGMDNQLISPVALDLKKWHFLVATFDGKLAHVYADGTEVASGSLLAGPVKPEIQIGPANLPNRGGFTHFGGNIVGLTLSDEVLSAAQVQQLSQQLPDFSLPLLEEGSQPWPVQTHAQAGYTAPQDASLMPHSKTQLDKPHPAPAPESSPLALEQRSDNVWALSRGWLLAAAPDMTAGAAQISQPGFAGPKWIEATVPGTVLTSMIAQGLYPDPDFGLNNLAIPETLNKQQYWYRKEFAVPASTRSSRMILTFNGINYAAEVWLNGHLVGRLRGAFIRGSFDVTSFLKASGTNALAVLISPPPHPGIPQEQSLKGGPGENGGMMALDGPTFVASEGWDWIPAVRDRDTGIWQDVVLRAVGSMDIGDPQVITRLPLPDTKSADIVLNVSLNNAEAVARTVRLTASFEGVSISKELRLVPGESSIHLTPAEFPELTVHEPRLWWPNGYGKPELYHLKLAVTDGGVVSARKTLTFGIRQVTYELSLFDSSGKLRRVEVSPVDALSSLEPLVNVTHEGIRQTASGWAASLSAAGERSPAVKTLPADGLTDLVIKVNGVRIAARGGNWGMDDSRKRVSREHLEPYFRLHRDAHLNIIRNWVGQNSEEVFYQLADEYGLMVWNDFWASTQNYNLEPEDPQLFLRNAADVVARFRNHPSIVIWCGRNEGVPQPILNEGLISLLQKEDGTRYYTPSSNQINLRNSGPYSYKLPEQYFEKMNLGFAVEMGTPSFSTRGSFEASIGKADRWPVSDAWAYHDWHQSGGGDVHPFMEHMAKQFGAPTGFEDFERKAQMMNYVDYRAIFESFNDRLWSPNSGRLLWMTQPAWPSNNWQILSSDYDTNAAYYGVKKACEPLHVQFNPRERTVSVINTTNSTVGPLEVSARVYSLSNQLLSEQKETVTAKANAIQTVFTLEPGKFLNGDEPAIIRLEMTNQGGLISDNLYWFGSHEEAYRKLNALGPADIDTTLVFSRDREEQIVRVYLSNNSNVPALAVKLTPMKPGTNSRILPAYLSDNYLSMLPHEKKTVTIRFPASAPPVKIDLGIRGWNLPEKRIASH